MGNISGYDPTRDEDVLEVITSALASGRTIPDLISISQQADATLRAAADANKNAPLFNAMPDVEFANHLAFMLDRGGPNELQTAFQNFLDATVAGGGTTTQGPYMTAVFALIKVLRRNLPHMEQVIYDKLTVAQTAGTLLPELVPAIAIAYAAIANPSNVDPF